MLQIAKYLKNNRGQAMVEFALVVPVLLLLVFGIMEFSMVMHQYMAVAEGAREGARSAALGSNDAVVAAAAKNAAPGLESSRIEVSVLPTPERTRGESVTVTVSYPVTLVTPLIRAFFSEGYRVKGITVMRVE